MMETDAINVNHIVRNIEDYRVIERFLNFAVYAACLIRAYFTYSAYISSCRTQ